MSFARVYRVGVWFGFVRSALVVLVTKERKGEATLGRNESARTHTNPMRFVRSALLLAVVTCVVLLSEAGKKNTDRTSHQAMPGLRGFLCCNTMP